MLDRPAAKARLFSLKLAREAASLEALSPGKRYFEEQRLRAACDQELSRWLQEVRRELWTDLRQYAAEVRERRLLSREATGSDQDMVWNWAFLLPRQAVAGFQARIQDANARYARLRPECWKPPAPGRPIVFAPPWNWSPRHELPVLLHLPPSGAGISRTLLGVGGRPVYQVAHRRLSAAVSRIGPADLAPDLPRVRAYERVVTPTTGQGTVIPLRYGCVVEQESQVIELLDEHDPQYESLLQELEGCVEMGLRVLLPSGPWPR